MEHLVLCAQNSVSQNPGEHHPPSLSTRTLGSYLERNLPDGRIRISVVDFPASSTPEQMLSRVASLDPDVVGLSCYLWNYRTHFSLVDLLHDHLPEVPVILGGPQIDYDEHDLARLFRRHPGIDLLVQGEGELQLLDYFKTGRHQRPKGQVVLSGRPLPSLDTVGGPLFERYPPPEPISQARVETSRGCAFACAFCNLAGRAGGFRRKSDQQVRGEIGWAVKSGLGSVEYTDAGVNVDEEHFDRLLSAVEAADPARQLTHQFEMDYRALKRHQVERLREFRTCVGMGIESIHPEACRLMRRNFNRTSFENVMSWFEEAGMETSLEMVLGAPGDTLEGFQNSLDYALRFDQPLSVFVLRILPGTEFYRRRAEYKLVYDEEQGHRIQSTFSMSAGDITRACDLVRQKADEATSSGRRARIVLWDRDHPELLYTTPGTEYGTPAGESDALRRHACEFLSRIPDLALEKCEPQSWEGTAVLVCDVRLRSGETFSLAFVPPEVEMAGFLETTDFRLVYVPAKGESAPSPRVQEVLSILKRGAEPSTHPTR